MQVWVGSLANRNFFTIALPIMASVAYVVELSFVPLILPNIRDSLSLNATELALVFSAYATAVAIAVLVGGRFGDRFGPHKIFTLGVLLFIIGSLAVAVSSSQFPLIIGRVVQGIGGGLFSPLIPVLLASAAKPRPGRLLILWGSISGIIAGITPLVALEIIGAINWPFVFLGLAILALPAVFLRSVEEKVGGLENANSENVASSFLQPAPVWLLFGFIFCNFGTIMQFLFMVPVTLQDAGYSPVAQARSLAVFWVAFALSGVLLRNFVDTAVIWLILAMAPVFVVIGFGIFLLPMSVATLSLSSAFVGIGFACGNATSTTLILRYCREGTQAFAASLDISIARLGAVVVVFALAPIGPIPIFWSVTALSVAALLLGLLPLLFSGTDRTVLAETKPGQY